MSRRRLNEKQIAAIEYLSLPKRGGLTYGQVAEKVGVDERTLRRWRNDITFANELNRRTVLNLSDRLPEIVDSIPEHIINDGNAAMLRTAFQALGLLTDKVEVTDGREDGDMDDIKARISELRKGDESEGE